MLSVVGTPAPGAEPSRQPYSPGYEQVATEILRYITTHGLRPGERVQTEAEFARQLGVSRSQVREAVKTLAALGRVTVRKGIGILVSEPAGGLLPEALTRFLPVDVEDIVALFELRRLIESECARLAASRATPLELRRIALAADGCENAARADDFVAFRGLDTEFHCAVAAASHNSFFRSLLEMVTQLRAQVIDLALHGARSGSLADAAADHRAVIDAILDGEGELAAQRIARHVDDALSQYQQRIRERLFPAE